jgi:hypothetical protein
MDEFFGHRKKLKLVSNKPKTFKVKDSSNLPYLMREDDNKRVIEKNF